MSTSLNQCCVRGCGTLVPPELETEGFCVSHFLTSAERTCSEIRRETARGDSEYIRRAEIESYVSESAVKLALIGTGRVRLSDDVKKRVLTTFHTLMILHENLDHVTSPSFARQGTDR